MYKTVNPGRRRPRKRKALVRRFQGLDGDDTEDEADATADIDTGIEMAAKWGGR